MTNCPSSVSEKIQSKLSVNYIWTSDSKEFLEYITVKTFSILNK